MFSSEKQLVEKLVSDLKQKYDTQYIIRELRSGNNIADVVFATKIKRGTVVFNEYLNAYLYFNHIYNKKKLYLDDIGIPDLKTKKKFMDFIFTLEESGYVTLDGKHITSLKKIEAVTNNFVAIEAKLSDWRAGARQAERYKQYADKVYVAISAEYADKVDKELLRSKNIGLMCVSDYKLQIAVRAKREPVERLDIQFYMEDRFLKQMQKALIRESD